MLCDSIGDAVYFCVNRSVHTREAHYWILKFIDCIWCKWLLPSEIPSNGASTEHCRISSDHNDHDDDDDEDDDDDDAMRDMKNNGILNRWRFYK